MQQRNPRRAQATAARPHYEPLATGRAPRALRISEEV